MAILVLMLYSVLNVWEAVLEKTIIELKNPYLSNYKQLNKREHSESLIYSSILFVIILLFILHLDAYWLIGAIVVNRRLCFDFTLKDLRDRPLFTYEGDSKIDMFLKRVFGEKGAWKEFIIITLITVGSLLLFIFNNPNKEDVRKGVAMCIYYSGYIGILIKGHNQRRL